MTSEKIHLIIGYSLLCIGVLLIVLPLFQTYMIFIGASVPPQVFKTQPVPVVQNNNPFDVGQQVQNAFIKILPIDLINSTLNLTNWIILLWILMFGGGQLANLGIKLLQLKRGD